MKKMNAKGLLVLTVFFASLLIIGSVGAIESWRFPIPTQITLIPTSNFLVNDISFVYSNISSLRYDSLNINLTNKLYPENLTCKINVDFYQNATIIAWTGWQSFAFNATQTKVVTVILTWQNGKNLIHMTSGTLTIV